MKTALVLGGGFAGCVMAYFLRQKGFKVKLFEASQNLGGGCRTYFYHGHPYTFGPHHLLVPVDRGDIMDFFRKFLHLRKIHHYMMTYVEQDNEFYSYPPHIDDIIKMPDYEKIEREIKARNFEQEVSNFEDFWLNSIGETLYNKYINNYSKKMWQIRNNKEIDAIEQITGVDSVIQKGTKERFVGIFDVMYPSNLDGYNAMFEQCVEGCEVYLSTEVKEFDLDNKQIRINGEYIRGDVIINTLSLDLVFEYCYGELRYIGRDFQTIILPIEQAIPDPYHFIHYPGQEESFTRIVEYKKMTGYQSKHTLLGIETPSFNNKLYPYQTRVDIERANKYQQLLPKDCYAIGRMATYRYLDMSMIVRDCIELVEKI